MCDGYELGEKMVETIILEQIICMLICVNYQIMILLDSNLLIT
jgi:hypothetical protein